MALTKCKDCGNEISKSSKTCPKCGSSNPAKKSKWKKIVIFLILIGIFASLLTNVENTPTREEQINSSILQNPDNHIKEIRDAILKEDAITAKLKINQLKKASPNDSRLAQLNEELKALNTRKQEDKKSHEITTTNKSTTENHRDRCGRTNIESCQMYARARSNCATAGNIDECMTIKYEALIGNQCPGDMWKNDKMFCTADGKSIHGDF